MKTGRAERGVDITLRPVLGARDKTDQTTDNYRSCKLHSTEWHHRFGFQCSFSGRWVPQEAKLNAVPQFTLQVNGLKTHFIHQRSKERETNCSR